MSNADRRKQLQIVRDNIESYPDFPKPGILFRDIFSVLKNPNASRCLFDLLLNEVKQLGRIDAIIGLESRGFLLGVNIASSLDVPFVPIRKKGKLPGNIKQVKFALEYGTDTFEIQENSICAKQKVLIIDDLLATGGSLAASCQLVTELGAEVIQCLVVIELSDLKGRCNIPVSVTSLIQF